MKGQEQTAAANAAAKQVLQDNAVKIQAVINTIESLDIKATFENANKVMGCLQQLADIRDTMKGIPLGEVKTDGNSDAE